MSEIVIKAENLGKKYIIGHRAKSGGYTALRDVLMQNANHLWQKTKDLLHGKPVIQGDTTEEVWALNNLSFEIRRGEVVGIIGRNGAGKSTLLKILSRITEPSAGRVTIKGRVASLLEVGTGFHPELTGRENIYLNGAIMGMVRQEIKCKFDEIVAFAEVEKFLDTPVKRYSSGMYIRLAFAVAAHLEPEILLVDEVLAVGDAAFQKKCLWKMGQVAEGGRTVLFVSHNMGAVTQLCEKGILLNNGHLESYTSAKNAVSTYMESCYNRTLLPAPNFTGTLKSVLEFKQISINKHSMNENIVISPSSNIKIKVDGECKSDLPAFRITISVFRDGVRLLTLHDSAVPELLIRGDFFSEIEIPPFFLRPGSYSIAVGGYREGGSEWIWGTDLMMFNVAEEWSDNYDASNIGLINLPRNGRRQTFSRAR